MSTRVSVETREKKKRGKKKENMELGRDGDFGNTRVWSLG